jgi:hypothetical protein
MSSKNVFLPHWIYWNGINANGFEIMVLMACCPSAKMIILVSDVFDHIEMVKKGYSCKMSF